MDVGKPLASQRDGPGEKFPPEPGSARTKAEPKKNKLGCCISCGFELRRSRLQKGDFLRLLMFQVPARCRRCGDRQHAFAPLAILSGEPWRAMKRPASGSGPARKNWSAPFAAGPINIRQRNAPMVPPEVLLDEKTKPPVRGRADGYIW